MTTHRSVYKCERSNDMFAIEIDSQGHVVSTYGLLLSKDINPEQLDYDNYWDSEVKAQIKDFILLSEGEFLELLRKHGSYFWSIQRHLFE